MTIIQGLINHNEHRSLRLDRTSHALRILDLPHSEIHDGEHYMAGYSDQLANAGDHIDVAMATPGWTPTTSDDHDTTFHLHIHVWSSQPFSSVLQRRVTSISGGTVIPPFNNNMNWKMHSNTSQLDVTAGSLTIVGGETVFGPLYRGARAEQAQGRSEEEIILPPAEICVYSMTMLSTAAANVGIRISWYEATPKH